MRACASCCGITGTAVAPDAYGRLDLDAVEAECAKGDVGTVVLTTGSTGLGAIDRVDEALALRERYGVRLHVDGAYGGFFTLLARGDDPLVAPAPYAAIAQCDSVVVDPHKHGLQPYGCGAILFADPAVAARLSPRLALHLLHRGRAAPRRDQPRVLARRRGGRRAVADAPGAAARARRGPGRGARGRAPRGARLGAAPEDAPTSSRCTSSPSSTSSPTCRARARCRRSTPPAAPCSTPAWRTPRIRSS